MVSPARKKKRRWSITERDLAALAHLARYGAATAEQIRREFFGDSLQSAYRRLRALEDRGVLKGERIFYRMPQIYRVTEPGARLSETDLPPPRHDLSRLAHTLEVAELSWKVRSEEEAAVEGWRTEREIRRDKLRARREKGSGRMLKKGRMGRIPDGVIVLENGHEIAVELELTPKRAANYRRIFSDYEAHLEEGEYDEVRFYFASETAMRRVEELSESHDLDGYIEFRPYEPVFEQRR